MQRQSVPSETNFRLIVAVQEFEWKAFGLAVPRIRFLFIAVYCSSQSSFLPFITSSLTRLGGVKEANSFYSVLHFLSLAILYIAATKGGNVCRILSNRLTCVALIISPQLVMRSNAE